MHFLSGIWGDQCIIFRDQESTDPPARGLIIKDFKCFNDNFTDSGYLSNNRRRLLKSGTALERRFPSVDGSG